MSFTTFFHQHSFKLSVGFAVLGFLCWLCCLSPLTISLKSLQQIIIYLGLEILYDFLRHWGLKLAKNCGDRLCHASPFLNDCFALVTEIQTQGQKMLVSRLSSWSLGKNINNYCVFSWNLR
jgi:hypothetical protein